MLTRLLSAAPSITSFVPSNGPLAGGNRVTLIGVRLGNSDVTAVAFGPTGTEPAVTWLTSTLVVVVAPAQSTAGAVTVSLTSTSFGTGISTGSYTANPAGVITSVAPASVANEGGVLVTLSGINLGAADITAVSLCGVAASATTFVTSTRVLAIAGPRTDSVACGPGSAVVVSTSFGTTTMTFAFNYLVRTSSCSLDLLELVWLTRHLLTHTHRTGDHVGDAVVRGRHERRHRDRGRHQPGHRHRRQPGLFFFGCA
jgi:hypothetical protein